MKIFAAAATLLLTFAALVALAPAGAAVKAYCLVTEPDCPRDQLACVLYPTTVCVKDPCATTSCTLAASDAPCYRQDYGHYTTITCVNPTRPDCLVETTRSMAGETFVTCTGVPTLAAAAALPDSTSQCHHLVHGHGFDSFLCYDVKGPVGCKVYTETYRWETGTTRNCIA